MRHLRWVLGFACACLAAPAVQSSALDEYVRLQAGSFTS
jgi:hypothetical protein